MRKLTTADFIKKAQEKHGDRYDYSKVDYANARTKVEIICKEHGSFYQMLDKHLRGQGCPICAYKVRQQKHTKSFEDMISKAIKIHKDDYTYFKKDYVNSNTKMKIKCNKCGSYFYQKLMNHIYLKQGCPFCQESKLEQDVKEVLLENNIIFEQQKHFQRFQYSSHFFFHC